MCGIAGFFGEGDGAVLADMAGRIAHRGPDGEGFLTDERARMFLAHRRLAILDLAAGAQPMGNEDGQVVVVFNGEIYNHRALRQELTVRGHRFASDHSDTEVLVHGWEEWGTGLPDRLNGMFAFAIWDKRGNTLFLARDRFGKKPLFVAQTPQAFVFASELSALLAHPGLDRAIDRLALKKYFAYGFLPAPYTPYLSARKLPGGHWMLLDLATGQARTHCYWRFKLEAEPAWQHRSGDDLADELRELVARAVDRRLESDVPLGALLSGGVDSSAVVASMAGQMPTDRLLTFAMGFSEPSFDESAHARAMAQHVGNTHHATICAMADAKDELASLLSRLDEPTGDASILPTWMVCRFARSRVTVALTGDGADELFGGYDPFAALAPTRLLRAVMPAMAVGWAGRLADLLPRSDTNMSLDFKIRRWLQGARQPAGCWLPAWMAPLSPEEIARLFGEPTDVEDLYSEAIAAWGEDPRASLVDRALEYFTRFYLPDDILVKADRASMLNGLELRSPFLDSEVADFARRLPARWKFHRGNRKILLKRAFAGLVPASLLERRKKGFGMPIGAWLRGMEPPATHAVPEIDGEWFARRWQDHRDRKRDDRLALFAWQALASHFGGAQ